MFRWTPGLGDISVGCGHRCNRLKLPDTEKHAVQLLPQNTQYLIATFTSKTVLYLRVLTDCYLNTHMKCVLI